MGTDVHMYAEVRDPETGAWKMLGKQFPYPYFREGDDESRRLTNQVYMGRNYKLFAALADVRNGTGFAGVPTGSVVIPVAEPRGLPEDISPELAHDRYAGVGEDDDPDYDLPYLGDHSFSWLTLAEVLAYDWDQPIYQTGVMSAGQYRKLRDEKIAPESWSGGISGPGIITYSAEDFDRREKLGTLPEIKHSNVYVQASWPQAGGLRACISDEWFSTIIGLADAYGPDTCRLVFGFDS